MLRYNCSIRTSSNSQDIVLDDFYVSPDLSFVSGTTENVRICSAGDTVWVRTPLFPNDIPVKVTSNVVVKRNGYILVPRTLKIHKPTLYTAKEASIMMRYVEMNGNTYFSDLENYEFIIDGVTYPSLSGDTFLNNVYERIYIENDELIVNGITYNATINNKNELSLTDSVGDFYSIPSTWNLSNVDVNTKLVLKLSIGENFDKPFECKRLTYYGHKPYIIYNNQKKYLEYFYDEYGNIIDGGVIIDGVEYSCDGLCTGNEYYFDPTNSFEKEYNLYNINDYYEDDNGHVTMTINDELYIVYFEPRDIYDCGLLGIETEEENLPILIGDKISIHSVDETNEVQVRYDDNNNAYIYLNGNRYDSVKNLCDSIVLGGIEYELVCDDGDCENPTSGMILSCNVNDFGVMYFKPVGIEDNKIKTIKQVESTGNGWEDVYSMTESGNTVVYSASTYYDVVNYDGIMIGDYKAKIRHYEYTAGEGDAEIDRSYDYVVVNTNLDYRLNVINTVGTNMLICLPDIDETVYGEVSKEDFITEILYYSLQQGKKFLIERRTNAFGVSDLYYDTWMRLAAQYGKAISVYELANFDNNIHLIRKSSHYTIPIGLQKTANLKMGYDDLITSQYYEEEAEKAVNKPVDMEKYMYSPVVRVGDNFVDLERIEFNFHFRTRELDTWKIIEDEGTVYEPKEYIPGLSIEQGTISSMTGENNPNSDYNNKRLRTQDLISGDTLYITTSDDKFIRVFGYKDDGTYMGFVYDIKESGEVGIDGATKYRVVFGYVDNRTITPQDFNSLGITVKAILKPQVLSANYKYCNWFITDYYPFNIYNNRYQISFGKLCEVSDLLGLMYFTTNDVETKREKLRKSFLRLTFFDSKNPEKQNLLGTSTLYFDCDRYLDVLNKPHKGFHFEEVAKSQVANRVDDEGTGFIPGKDQIPRDENRPNVLTEAFTIPKEDRLLMISDLYTGDDQPTLNSKIIVKDRYTGNNSSEGFYSYILKAFADKTKEKTIYMKAEFFHAGVGQKIPMIIPTDSNKNAIQKNDWNKMKLDEFKKGYDLNSIFERLYVPIKIEYSRDMKKFVYHISDDNNYLNSILKYDENNCKWVFNLFELKIKP